jgi:hypothetical protein
MNRVAVLLTSALLLAGSAITQESAPKEKVRAFAFTQDEPFSVTPPGFNMMFQRGIPEGEISFFSAEMAGAGEVVTAAPYTATAITETTQVLADGNRIVNKTSALVARDSQGRTRKETSLHRIGPLQMDSPKLVFINDPTTHVQYILTPGGEGTKVIRKSAVGWDSGPNIIDLQGGAERHAIREKIIARSNGPAKAEEVSKQVKHEELGTQTMEGVSAEGRRETVTIPAGQIGNERPIEIVTEVWSSPELHMVVMRKHTDPRVGETVFRLTDIKRNEPDASLFQPPANAKIKAEPVIELRREAAPAKD